MRKLEKIEQVHKLATSVKKKLTAEQQTFLQEHNYLGYSTCIVLNPTQADEKIMDSISAKMDIRFICLVEPPDEPEIITN